MVCTRTLPILLLLTRYTTQILSFSHGFRSKNNGGGNVDGEIEMLMAIEAASPSRISAVDHQKQEQILSTSSCELDAAGFYGEPTGQAYEIEFVYQVTTTPEATPEIVDEDVTPALDVAVIAEMLPFLFPSACQSSKGMERRTKGLRQLQQQGVFNGISMREQDELIAYADGKCNVFYLLTVYSL